MGYNENLRFYNNITPLDEAHLNELINNIDFVYNTIKELIPTIGTSLTPLPAVSGDGVIRYVISVKQDMIYLYTPNNPLPQPRVPTGIDPTGRYFVAKADEDVGQYHLEVGNYTNGEGESDPKYAERIAEYGGKPIQFSQYAGDVCTHDKLYLCENTGKCYYMLNKVGVGTGIDHIDSGTTEQAPAFMTEAAQAASQIYQGSWDGEGGMPRQNFYRFKVVTLTFDFATSGSRDTHGRATEDNAPGMFTVAFDPGYFRGNNQGTEGKDGYLYIPMCIAYGNDIYGNTISGKDVAFLRIYNSEQADKFYFDVVRDLNTAESGNLAINLRAIVGVADTMLGWSEF